MTKKYIISAVAMVFVVIGLFMACSKGSGSNPSYTRNGGNGGNGSSTSVTIQNYAFNSSALTVDSGVVITWTNKDAVAHTVTANDGSFDSGDIQPGATFQHTFTTRGKTVSYHCRIHTYMIGTITVN